MKDCPSCQALRDEIEVLKRALGEDIPLPIAFHLTRTEGKMLRVLIKREGMVASGKIMDAVYSLEMNKPEPQIVNVYICRMRKVLKPYGISIGNKLGLGYYMMPEDKAKIAALVAAERAVAA